MMTKKKQTHTETGMSLLIVLLIGSIMLLTSIATGEYAFRMVKSLRAMTEATQALYTAEETFACVSFWLNKDTRNFTGLVGGDISCNGTTFNFSGGTDTAPADGIAPTFTGTAGGGTGTFRIPVDASNPMGQGVVVEVENSGPISEHRFLGNIRIYSQTGALTSNKTSERFQDYSYTVTTGADIMFVVDRSGSIDRSDVAEWDAMIESLTGSIRTLNREVPMPNMGIVSFGRDATDVGNRVGDTLVPDVRLTDTYTNLINNGGTLLDYTDDLPKMRLTESVTNLSLGISIAGLELMQKSYPYNGLLTAPGAVGVTSGEFERLVAGNSNLNVLPSSTNAAMDRNDTQYPDVIVVISDGAPNVIMTHLYQPNTWYWSSVYAADNDFAQTLLHDYQIGEAKLFRTWPTGSGNQIIDWGNPQPTVLPPDRYRFCNDDTTGSNRPQVVLNSPVNSDTWPHFAMCNVTIIANKLKTDENIKFIVIYIGTNNSSDEALWLRNQLSTCSIDPANPNACTDPEDFLFAQVTSFADIQSKLIEQFEKLEFTTNR